MKKKNEILNLANIEGKKRDNIDNNYQAKNTENKSDVTYELIL